MHKIDHATATSDGLFTIGDPVASLPATVVTADWLNAVQTEIVNVIEGAGEELDKPDNTQLLASIEALIAAAGPWRTGDVKLSMQDSAQEGWIACDDGTIGNASSAATSRANDDTEALYTLLWNKVSNSYAPVSGGRGVSAAVDFEAGKTIGLTKMMGRALAVAGAGDSLTARSLGEAVGAETHTLTEGEMPKHGHPFRVSSQNASSATSSTSGGFMLNSAANANKTAYDGAPSATLGQQIGGTGGGEAHANMQPTAFLHAHIKL